MRELVAFVAGWAAAYLLASFVWWDFNPAAWGMTGRIVVTGLGLVAGLCAAAWAFVGRGLTDDLWWGWR